MTDKSNEQEIRFLGDLQRLEVRSGDRFVLTVPSPLSHETVTHIQEMWDRLDVSPGKLIVLQDGYKLGVIGKDE